MVELIHRRRWERRMLNFSGTTVLLVKSVDYVLRIVLDDVRICEDGHPVTCISLGGLDPIHAEAAREAGNATEHGFEGLDHVMGSVILEN
jgi:hypothetical protein